MDDDASLPQPMPGQGGCPPGTRPGSYQGMPAGARACLPIGPGVPAGGWKPARPGAGPGYPPSGASALAALDDATFAGDQGGALGNFTQGYADWLSMMARR